MRTREVAIGSRPSPAARRRLERIRWSMTLFFALTTAACMVALAVFFAATDAAARHRVDDGLRTQARLVSEGVTHDGRYFSFATGTTPASGAGFAAIGTMPAGFVDARGIEYASPRQSSLPSSAVISAMYAGMRRAHASVFQTVSGRNGVAMRWVARPLDPSDVAMTMVGAPAAAPFSRRTLVLGLVLAVAVLVLLGTVTGHVLSGRAMRPAVRQVERQEQFLREAAHELRTPLATLGLIAESGIRHPDTADQALRDLQGRLERMTGVVTSLLARARSESGGEIDQRLLRLDQLVEVTVDELDRGALVSVDAVPTVVRGNADLVEHAVRNLVENAIRHTDGPVRITVRDRCFAVADSGSGVPERLAGRADGIDPGVVGGPGVGTGTGLSIVRWVADLHHATLRFEGRPGGGLVVSLEFPTGDTR
ncbi:two-component sensor histidine kinase [Curtobacterium sp. MCBD17_013]|uniref:sensor histidine kinase n=1 Tax=Curtobacterium sp. MCBD17_013 TaxID=2175668 RepID=UPI000DA97BD3|nr:HAMP domain-containing sensor histidine kinase [Curtobacterium sp. MCBD17_013]PZF60500.1 two-component sensor histidine kinase [Curtobacterium sp. MCBD17_013]